MAADVSIIVPAYNMERFLVETLDSIEAAIKPTSLAVEVIVMDDGSTDGSLALARNYAAHHANIRVLTQPNAGPSVARNRAINEATGRYISHWMRMTCSVQDFWNMPYRYSTPTPK